MRKTNEDHPNDLMEKGKAFDEVFKRLKEAREMLLVEGYEENSVGLKGINDLIEKYDSDN